MKALFIAYNQAYNEEIADLLEQFGQRGFTRWTEVSGRGSEKGEPHYGSHAWPVLNHAMLAMVGDDAASGILAALREKDRQFEDLGLRAFCWTVEEHI